MGELRGHIEGADDEARKILNAAARLRQEIREVMGDVASDAEIIFAAHALKGESGRLARGISTKSAGTTLLVQVHARNPKTGYDYVGVTRFGHRKKWIEPKHPPKAERFYPKTAKAFPINGKFYSSIKGFAALQGPFGYRRRVRGFKPESDWAADAIPEIVAEAEDRVAQFGRGFTVKMS